MLSDLFECKRSRPLNNYRKCSLGDNFMEKRKYNKVIFSYGYKTRDWNIYFFWKIESQS